MREENSGGSNTGKILLIVGGVLLLLVVACGVAGFSLFKKAGTAFGDLAITFQANVACEEFLGEISAEQVQLAYDSTSDNFKATTSRVAFDALLAKHPLLKSHKYNEPIAVFVKPAGTAPNRTQAVKYTLFSADPNPHDPAMDEAFDEDEDGAMKAKPKPKPKAAPSKPPADVQKLSITIRLVEAANLRWKVDGLTIP